MTSKVRPEIGRLCPDALLEYHERFSMPSGRLQLHAAVERWIGWIGRIGMGVRLHEGGYGKLPV